MDNYLSQKTALKLQEWGCDVPTDIVGNGLPFQWSKEERYHNYDIRDIICYQSKAFFGENDIWFISKFAENRFSGQIFMSYLQEGEKELLEDYLLEHTIFNPKNKK